MLLYRGRDGPVSVEVHRYDDAIELTRDGILHTSYSPDTPLTGDVWDCLAMGSLLLPDRPQNVLVLGLGGGAVVNLLSRYQHCRRLVAVDLSPLSLELFERFFCDAHADLELELIHQNADAFVRNYDGALFDYVVDDVFCEDDNGEPIRAIPFSFDWYNALCALMTPDGVLVANFGDSAERRRSCLADVDFEASDENALVLRSTESLNEIVALTTKRADARYFWTQVRNHPVWGTPAARRIMTLKTGIFR